MRREPGYADFSACVLIIQHWVESVKGILRRGAWGVRRGAGISPDVRASDDPHTRRDEALAVAARVLQQRLGG